MDEHNDERIEQTSSTPGSGNAGPTDTEADAGLRELALRLLRWPSLGDALGDLQLLPGALPSNLPFAVPLPPGARVVGTLTSRREIRVVLDANLSPERVLAYYQEQLRPAGWHETQSLRGGQPRGGFLNTAGPWLERLTLWFAQEPWVLSVEVAHGRGAGSSAGSEGSTDVWLTFYADARSQRPRGPKRFRQEHFDPGKLAPPLAPPAGARQRSMGSGGSFDNWRSSARLATELDLATVAAHYARQLERAGWTRRGGEERGDGIVRSAWDVVDEDGEPWQGQLVALRQREAPGAAERAEGAQGPGVLGVPGVYQLEVRLLWAGAEPDGFVPDGPVQHQRPRGPRRAQQEQQQRHFYPGELVPHLAPPAGAQQRSMGGGGSLEDMRSSFQLATELDLAAVVAHYAQQLERAGWTPRGGEASGGVMARCDWDVVDEDGEPWQGQLVALRRQETPGGVQGVEGAEGAQGPGIYLLEVRVSWVGGEPDAFLPL